MGALGVAVLSSCNDFLDTTSPSQMDLDFVYSNTEDATQALNGVYVLFCEDPFTSRMSCVWMQNTDVEAYGPSAGRPNGAHRSDIWGLQASEDAGFSDVYNAWNNCLQAIDRANQVINGVNESSIGDDSEMQQIKGEAVCLKATRYLMMCNFWGDVPYYDTPAMAGQELDKPREDKFRIYSRLLQELVDIEGNMKFSDVNTGGIERMNRDYALGLIAKMALFRAGYGKTVDNEIKRADDYLDVTGDETLAVTYVDNSGNTVTARTYTDYYQMSKNYSQKLIQLKPRALRADYNSIFLDENQYTVKNNDEVLYEVAFTESFGGDVGWCIGVTNTNSSKGNGTTTNQVGLTPAYYMSFADNDIRRDVTCAWWSHDNDTIAFASNVTSIMVGKWDRLLATKSLGTASSKGTGINWPMMRYADVMLMLAEAENELNGPTDLAKSQLTAVRARAFASSPTYAEDVTEYVSRLTSKDLFFNAIVNERAWEFGGECLRRFDLIRWNLYGEKINSCLRTMQLWGISTVEDLMNDQSIMAKYSDAADYLDWADVVYYDIANSGTSNSKSDITVYNPKYRVTTDEAEENGWKLSKKWGSYLISTVTTYRYNGVIYTGCTKTTNNADETATYALTGGDGTPKETTVTVATGSETGITRIRTYKEADALARMFRGYTGGGVGQGTGPVPYLFPIPSTTLSSSTVLNNDGYGFSTTYTGDDVPVEYGVIEKDYK